MSNDDRTDADSGPDSDSGSDAEVGSGSGSGSGEEIPISTGGDDASAADGPGEAMDDGIEIDVETGSPGPDAERRSAGGTETDLGDSGGLFDRLDESVVELLSRALGAETHLRVYVALRRRPWSTPEAVAEATGLYPRTVRDALEALESSGAVERRGPATEPDDAIAGDDGEDARREPEYAAVAPSAVLTDVISGAGDGGLPERLDVDRYLGSETTTRGDEPVRIDIADGDDDEANDADETGGRNDVDTADDADAAGGDGTEDGREGDSDAT